MIELSKSDRERCILVGVSTRTTGRQETEELLDELALLADTAGGDVIARFTQDRDRIDPASFIGKGKVEELRVFVEGNSIPLVVFDDDLSAVQVRNLERDLDCKVLDRSALILDIFAARAKSMEARTQVELAQLQYLLPRLTRQWTHLSKQFGGIGTKGPGETQIETDRRMIRARISHLKEKLDRIGRQRTTQRRGREKHTRAAMVGYTNVGKSTLLNSLSGSEVFVENRLFATLDPTTRLVPLTQGVEILVTDTVGFIRKLPHHLVASFKSTLEEITEADLLLHIADISSRVFEHQIKIVQETLHDLGCSTKPTLMVFNKIDRLADRGVLHDVAKEFPNSVFISAKRGINLPGLKNEVFGLLEKEFVEKVFTISQEHQKVISYLYSIGEIREKTYQDNSVVLKVRIPKKDEERLNQIIASGGSKLTDRD
ncbi:MAG TPA: GTPase HflX [Bacteroidota bacterium]|nr:GTPase HflX [Bacteroidota bacterium]